jgi:hypothetical protein
MIDALPPRDSTRIVEGAEAASGKIESQLAGKPEAYGFRFPFNIECCKLVVVVMLWQNKREVARLIFRMSEE